MQIAYASTLGQLAEEHGMTPRELYAVALDEGLHGREGRPRGRGMGRKTLAAFCQEAGLDLARALERLRDAGFEATGAMTLWDIADQGGLRPHDVRSIVEGQYRKP